MKIKKIRKKKAASVIAAALVLFLAGNGAASLTHQCLSNFSPKKEQVENLKKDLMEKYDTASKSFADAGEKDREFLTMFSFICLLSFDVYMKKQLIESIIDSFPSD